MARGTAEKFKTALSCNTFWFNNKKFEQEYEAHVTTMRETLLVMRNQVQSTGLTKELLVDLIAKKEYGLQAVLALIGLSNESFKRLVTFIRVFDDPELSKLSCRDRWLNGSDTKEWSDKKIADKLRSSLHFRKGIVNLLYEGATVSALARTLPLFELKKFSVSKLSFDPEAMIDTLIRSKEKGSYAGQKEHNPEVVIDELLADMGINYSHGDLPKLKQHHQAGKRMMDFIIPDRNDPKIIIESSYMTTTSSGQGDKSKVELSMRQLIKKHYPNAHFWGFVDGIGWYVRQTDLRRMVKAYEDVFTFRDDEIMRFRSALEQIMARR